MMQDPKRPEPGSAEDLGLTKPDTPAEHEQDDAKTEEKGEPFDGNFA